MAQQAGDPEHPAPTRKRADRLVEKIEAGDLDPSEVSILPFVENDSDVFTPELAELLPDETVQEYNERIEAKQRESLEAERDERIEEHQEAINALMDATDETATVAINDEGDEVEVKAYLNEHVEQTIYRMGSEYDTLDDATEDMIEAISWLVVDEDYANPDVWRAFKRERGASGLQIMFEKLTDPAWERLNTGEETVGNSHSPGGDR